MSRQVGRPVHAFRQVGRPVHALRQVTLAAWPSVGEQAGPRVPPPHHLPPAHLFSRPPPLSPPSLLMPPPPSPPTTVLTQGRATVEMKVHLSASPQGPTDAVMKIVLDGYNAPVSAGTFVDLVQRKFYDGMEIQRADGFVVQTGDPDGPDDGFKDASGKIRT